MIEIIHFETKLGVIYVATFPDNDKKTGKEKVNFQTLMKEDILMSIFKHPVSLKYKESGAPFISEFPELFISLSHSSNKIAVYISKIKPIGIDIQWIKDGIYPGRSYFINEIEENDFNAQLKDNTILLSIWCVKETVYKQLGGISNAKNDLIVRFSDNREWKCDYQSDTFDLDFKKIDDFLLFYSH